jgi:cis-3-alkyl-4-acyloxetan-2-one decarboxylase
MMANELYPFTGSRLDRPGGRLHFLDEGRGAPIVMLHGNPTWSFYFRNLVLALRDSHRCIVPDHIGCGRSSKPARGDYEFSLKSRIDDVEALLDAVGVREKVTLVVQDWGGMIGLGYAARHPDRVARIIATNTGCGRLPASKGFPWSLWLGRNTKLGEWLILQRNWFCKFAAKWCVTRKPLAPDVRAMYLEPYDTPAHRLAVLKFVQTIPLKPSDAGYDIVVQVEETLKQFAKVPTLLLWGMKDFVFDRHFLADWQKHFPHAETHTWPDCGHYLLEDAHAEVIVKMKEFLAKHPIV